MSWFSRRPAPAKEPAPVRAEREPETHRSLALPSLLAEIARRPKAQVLDLGPALGSNVEFFHQFGCKLYIEDLFSAIVESPRDGEERLDFAAHFGNVSREPIDLVFAWDLFNYLSRRELTALGDELGRLCRPGAVVFALLSFLKQMPAQPQRFRIKDGETLGYERQTTAERPSPRYASSDMAELFPGFTVDRSFLLRHGYMEYLLIRTPHP
jgi:hypothetical protein